MNSSSRSIARQLAYREMGEPGNPSEAVIVGERRFEPVCTSNRFHVDALILGEVRRLRPASVLDVGCANGRFAREIDAARVVGVEIDPELASLATDACDPVVVGDIENADVLDRTRSEGPFDAILLLDVVEHLPRPEHVLVELAGMASERGRLFLSVPNLLYYRERLRLLLGHFETSPSGGLYDRTHLRYFSRRELEATLERTGLAIERLTGAANIRSGRKLAQLPAPVPAIHSTASLFAHTLAQIRPELFARSFVVTALPRERISLRAKSFRSAPASLLRP